MPVWTEDDRMIADSTDALFGDLGGVGRLRPRAVLMTERLTAEGWDGLLRTEDQGGIGVGIRGAVAALQAAGRNIAPEPLAGMAVAGWLLGESGTPADGAARSLLPGFARAVGSRWTSGAIPGLSAQTEAVLLFCGDELRVVKTAEAALNSFSTIDGGCTGRIACEGNAGQILAKGPAVEAWAARASDLLRLLGAAELNGIAAEALRIVSDYVGTRRQFGISLSSHQVIQHRLADVKVALTASEALVYEAVRGFEGEAARRAASARFAWRRAVKAATLSTREAVQFHGAIGFTYECDIGLFLRRATALMAGVNALLPDEAWPEND